MGTLYTSFDMVGSYDQPQGRRSVLGDFWYKSKEELAAGKNRSGVEVTEGTALNYSAFWACNALICDTLAALPRTFHLLTSKQTRMPAPDHPAAYVWDDEPNPAMDGQTLHGMNLFNIINWGDSLCYKERDDDLRIKHLWPIHPSRLIEIKLVNGRKQFKIQVNDIGPPTVYDQDEIFHVPGRFSKDGLRGRGILSAAAESLGIAIAADRYAATYYGQGVHSGHFIKMDGTLSDSAYNRIKKDWQQKGGIKNAHMPLILEQGGELKQLFLPADQVQLLQSRNFNVTDMARWYLVPLHLLRVQMEKSGEATDSENKHFKIHTLQPWAVRYEKAYKRQCLGRKDRYRYVAEFDFNALTRADTLARSQEAREYWSIGKWTVNEINRRNGDNPIGADGDIRFVPENMTTIEAAKQKADLAARQVEIAEKSAEAKAAAPNDNKLDPANAPSGQKPSPTKVTNEGPVRAAIEMAFRVAAEEIVAFEQEQVRAFFDAAGEDWDKVKTFPKSVVPRLYSQNLPVYALGIIGNRLAPILAAGIELPEGLADSVIKPYCQFRIAALEVTNEKKLSEYADAVRSVTSQDGSYFLVERFARFLGVGDRLAA